MRLGALKWHWERLGKRDPYWAVLTHPDTRGGGWDLEQFFRSGVDEIAAVLQQAEHLGLTVPLTRALDFGCGVGRLTQAMAGHFGRCDGVDISASMLQVARRHDRHPDRCAYHVNTASDLSLFADASFTFVYSTLVLQHMEPRYAKGYVRELLRVLAPGGLLVFQVPSHRLGVEPSIGAASTRIEGPLPAAAFKARLSAESSSLSLRADELWPLAMTVENCSSQAWSALPDAWGRHRISVANHWLDEDGEQLERDDGRSPLPHDVGPGAQVDLAIGVTAPRHAGTYLLELDLVQEGICWFAQKGSEVLRIPCRVTGGLAGPPPRRARREIAPVPAPATPFRTRHPRLFFLLRVTRLRDIYWAWRHAVDHVKARRDRVIITLKERLFELVIAPIINWWRRKPFAPRMEMHCVPRAEVLEILAAGGGRVANIDEDLRPGGYQSCRYWVCKDRA